METQKRFMTDYNLEYINTHYALMEIFLTKTDKSILDISYSIEEKKLRIQIVLLKGSLLSKEIVGEIKNKFDRYELDIVEINLTKEEYNENRGEWQPKYYEWLEYLLLSKAEVL
jgi:hypothetical protein